MGLRSGVALMVGILLQEGNHLLLAHWGEQGVFHGFVDESHVVGDVGT